MFTNDYIDGLLAACDGDAPTGINVEYDPDFLALEAMLPDTAASMLDGADVAPTDWAGIRNAAEGILRRSKHLPSCVILTGALVETRGFMPA